MRILIPLICLFLVCDTGHAGICQTLARHIERMLPIRLEANKTNAPRSLKEQLEAARLNAPAIIGWSLLALAIPGWGYTVEARHAGIHNFFLEHYSNVSWMTMLTYFGIHQAPGKQQSYLRAASYMAVAAFLNHAHEFTDAFRQGFIDNADVQMGNLGIFLGFAIAETVYRFSSKQLVQEYNEGAR